MYSRAYGVKGGPVLHFDLGTVGPRSRFYGAFGISGCLPGVSGSRIAV